MNDVTCLIRLEEPMRASVRLLTDGSRRAPPGPPAGAAQRAAAAFMAGLDARMARADELAVTGCGEGIDEDAYDDGALAEHAPSMSFEAWAELSLRVLGDDPAEVLRELDARGLTLEEWERIDAHHLDTLAADVLVGDTVRTAIYAAMFQAEMARRAAVASCQPPAQPPIPGVAPAPLVVTRTAESEEVTEAVRRVMGGLPFQSAPPANPATGKAAVKTMPVPVMPDPGKTVENDGAIKRVIDALPFPGAGGSATVVLFPALTPQQYVSLCVDLAARPKQRAETLRRYGVPHEASLRAMVEHWQARLVAEPGLRAVVDAATETYTSWLRTLGR